MPMKPKDRLRSVRGQQIMKEYKEEQHMRRANLNYLRSNGVTNGNGSRVSHASRGNKKSRIENNNSKWKGSFMKEYKKDQQKRHANLNYPKSNGVSNGNGLRVSDASRATRESPVEDNNSKWKGSFMMNSNLDALPQFHNKSNCRRLTGRPSSHEGNGTAEGVKRLDVSGFKAMKSEKRHIKVGEDEGGDVQDKNPLGVEVEEAKNPTCIKDDYNLVVQVGNMTWEAIKEQREEHDIELDESNQNLVDVEDGNGGAIKAKFPMKMNTEAINDRGVQRLKGFHGKTQSNGRKESMQERRHVTLLGGGLGDNDDDDDDCEEVIRLRCGQKKKRRIYIVSSEDDDVEENGVDHCCVRVESEEKDESKMEVVMLTDYIDKVSMPLNALCIKQQCFCCSKPIDEPIWRGTLKVDGKEYTSLFGHLSNKSCKKVWNLSRSLETSVEVMKLSRLKVRSEIWGSSKPSAGNIGLYLFPHEMRHNANLDELINEIMGNDLVLRAVIGEAEMLIFPSCLLPEGYKTFQSKNYLWALFKQRDDKFAAAAKALNGTAWCAQEEEKGKEQASKHVDSIEPNQETILTESAMPLESQGLGNLHLGMEKQTSEGSVTAEGFQFKTPDERKQEDARRHSAHVAEATAAATNSSAVIAEATANATIASNVPANHKQSNPDTGAQPGKIIFVGAQTPRVEQMLQEMLQEMVREGSLELFMRAEKISLGPEPGSIATTMQQGTQHHRLDVRIISEPPPT